MTGFSATWPTLMKQAQAGDKLSYQRLLTDLKPTLERYFRTKVGDAASVDDLCQTTLLKIHVARHTFDPARAFEPWLFAIARNVLTDHRRGELSRGRWVESRAEVPEPRESDVSSPDERAQENIALERAFAALSPDQQAIVRETQLGQVSTQDAARARGITVGAFKVRAHRAYVAFRQALLPDDDQEKAA